MSAPAPQKDPTPAKPERALTVGPFYYNLVLFATGLPMWFGGGLRVEGREHVPLSGPVIVAGNHFTNLDPFVIAHALPKGRRIQYMAKKELFANPVLGYIIRSGGSFPVDRQGNDVGAIRTALRVLQQEGMLGIFPQGTRGGSTLQGGAAMLALKTKSPIVPASIIYARRKWRVRFGPVITPEGKVTDLTERIGAAIDALRTE